MFSSGCWVLHRQLPKRGHRFVCQPVNLCYLLRLPAMPAAAGFHGRIFPGFQLPSSLAAKKCRYCRAHIPLRVFWVELGTGILFAFLIWYYGLKPELIVSLFYGCILIVLAVIDLEQKLILNKIVYPAVFIAIIINIFLPDFGLKNFLFGLLGGAIGFVILLIPALIYSKGMGWGDVKMAGLIGFMVGYPRIFVAVLGSVILGRMVRAFLLVTKKKGRKEGIPFGPPPHWQPWSHWFGVNPS